MLLLHPYLITLYIVLDTFFLTHGRIYIKSMSDTVITTRFGKVRGAIVEFPSRHLRPITGYFGISYGTILGGHLRLMPSTIPSKTWTKEYMAIEMGPACPQPKVNEKELKKHFPNGHVEHLQRLAPFVSVQDEECLNLNLHVPIKAWNDTSSMPVMVFVHGESYDIGTGNAYEGSVLASYGQIIVVTLNYRLGPLGFLSTGDSVASGNYALLDIIAALHWLKENIGSFNGDPNRVTLFGHGYGASLVNLLLLSPMTRDGSLFRRAIVSSGTALSSWSVSVDPVGCTRKLALAVNCSKSLENSQELIKCLRERPYTDLINNVPLAPKYYSCFAPTVGGSVLPEAVQDLLKKPNSLFSYANVMFGITKNEAYSYLKQHEMEKGISEERKVQMVRTYVHNNFKYHKQKVFEILDHHYTDWDRITDMRSRRDNVMDLISDGQFAAPLIQVAQIHSASASTYLYNFGYSTQSHDYPAWSGGVHGDDLPYIFGAPLVDGIKPFTSSYTNSEKMLSEAVMRYWTNFAKTGDPNLPDQQTSLHGGDAKNRFVSIDWPKYNKGEQKYLVMGKRPSVRHHYRGQKLALWLDLIPKINQADGSDPEEHDLNNADNMSTFDDSERLLDNFDGVFISPPPMPPLTPPPKKGNVPNDGTGKIPSTIPQKSDNLVQNGPSFTDVPHSSNVDTTTLSTKSTTTAKNPAAEPSRDNETIFTSSVPLSITIAVGCSLLILNILILIGVYYQRRKARKSRRREDSEEINLRRKLEKEAVNAPEAESLMSTPTTDTPPKQIDSPSSSDSLKKPNKLSKPQNANCTYSALPTRSASPMHHNIPPKHNQAQPHPSHVPTKVRFNKDFPPPPPSQTGNLQNTSLSDSNNAITIV